MKRRTGQDDRSESDVFIPVITDKNTRKKLRKEEKKKTRLKLDIVSFVGRNSHTGCQETNRDELSKKNPNKKIRKLTGEREHEK